MKAPDPNNFEEPLQRLRRQIDEILEDDDRDDGEVDRLQNELEARTREVYADLSPWQKTLVARHPNRPYTLDYLNLVFDDFEEVHGDRRFADDPAIVAGFAELDGIPCAVMGHQKGRDTKEKIRRNFGMPRPEGYRKAMRVMRLAEKFHLPIFTFIDTPGAYPGMGAEERGQAEAIAVNLEEMAGLRTPIIVTVTGEGGSGGALALGVGDRVLMLEHSVYSVISPEGCAAILWKDPSAAQRAAEAMKITAPDLLSLGIIDTIVEEPPGGAHSDHEGMAGILAPILKKTLEELDTVAASGIGTLLDQRYEKFRRMGVIATL